MKFLPRTVPTLLAAGRHAGGVEFIYVDNGSTDGSYEYLRARESEGIRVYIRKGDTIAGMRNFGARQGRGPYLSFIDADCSIPERYFEAAVSVLRLTGAAATGCEIHVPEQPHWIEATWHDLHYVGRDRDVRYLNSGNFFVSRSAFEGVGGFCENMWTGEDAEIGERLVTAGERIHACPDVKAIHFGNPKSIPQFYRRSVWHGLGMFGTVSWNRVDKPTAMLAVHLIATLVGLAVLPAAPLSLALRMFTALGLQLAAPVATVVYRGHRTGRWRSGAAGILLYWLYYWARLHALALVTLGRSERYRK
jgi:glycosyltransferase involved in cell wall biosynthesis